MRSAVQIRSPQPTLAPALQRLRSAGADGGIFKSYAQVSRAAKGSDCKSDGFGLRWFESSLAHHFDVCDLRLRSSAVEQTLDKRQVGCSSHPVTTIVVVV